MQSHLNEFAKRCLWFFLLVFFFPSYNKVRLIVWNIQYVRPLEGNQDTDVGEKDS